MPTGVKQAVDEGRRPTDRRVNGAQRLLNAVGFSRSHVEAARPTLEKLDLTADRRQRVAQVVGGGMKKPVLAHRGLPDRAFGGASGGGRG